MEGKEYEYHEPVQTPISPPYKEACERKKGTAVGASSTVAAAATSYYTNSWQVFLVWFILKIFDL